MIKIAVCDDESEIRKSIANLIKKHTGDVEISVFQSGKEMLETTANFETSGETSGDGENGIFSCPSGFFYIFNCILCYFHLQSTYSFNSFFNSIHLTSRCQLFS